LNYAVFVTEQARHCVARLPDEMKKICANAHKILSEDPYRGHMMFGKLEGLRRFKVGPLRLIYELDEENRIITTVMIACQNGNR
jgi:mRNA-degrading endonuclease RelE of RelBE toxin-antitoxin system